MHAIIWTRLARLPKMLLSPEVRFEHAPLPLALTVVAALLIAKGKGREPNGPSNLENAP
jgi:hypothetical protein